MGDDYLNETHYWDNYISFTDEEIGTQRRLEICPATKLDPTGTA